MISIHQVHAWLHYKLLCLRDYLISQDSGFKNRNTRCMPGYKLLCMGVLVQKWRCHASATRKRAKRSFRFPPAKSKHHMSCRTPIYTLLFNKVKYMSACIIVLWSKSACIIVLLCATQPSSKMGGVTRLLLYQRNTILRTSLYFTSLPWHAFCPRARWEALSCGREPFCSHAIVPLLSMWKTDVALITPEVAFEIRGS